jgi:hypothetical protein
MLVLNLLLYYVWNLYCKVTQNAQSTQEKQTESCHFCRRKLYKKKKKFSEILYNLLIFSMGFQTIEEKVFRNEIQTARKDRNSAHYRTAMI